MARSWRAPLRTRACTIIGAVALLAGLTAVVARPAVAAAASTPVSPGYWLAASDGGVYQFATTNFGSMRGHALNWPVVGSATTRNGLGYWLVAADGGIFSFGDAVFHGSTGGIRLAQPIVGMAVDPATGGYWLVARDGGVFSFDAPFRGSTGNIRLNQPIVGMAATPDGQGYWLVASDGGVFSFGSARFHGSTGHIRLNRPVVGMATTPNGAGYWLAASDGGIFTFGNAGFHGSTGNIHLNRPIVGMAATANGQGYWLVASDGGMFTFGNAPFLGSTGGNPGPAPIVSVSTTTHGGFVFPPGGTGYDVSQWQCNSIPAVAQSVAIVQVSGGAINNPPNPCYAAEARWAGPNMSAYIYMGGLPSPAPPESQPGACGGNVNCESYNFGWSWAQHWVAHSRSLGFSPTLWWLDVEFTGWSVGSAYTASNAEVIKGAVAGLRATGVTPGIYSTSLQFGDIAGSLTFPNIALWIPGAGNLSGPGYSAINYCTSPAWAPRFAGGTVVLVQYGYGGSGYTGPPSPYDLDYACP